MYEHEVLDYVQSISPSLRGRFIVDDDVECREIGDGNLNLVYLLRDSRGDALCVKKALPYVRMVGRGWPLDVNRVDREHMSLNIFGKVAPGSVPTVYAGDAARHTIVMEALLPGKTARSRSVEGLECPGIGEAIGSFVGKIARDCSPAGVRALGYDPDDREFRNENMSDITRALVFEEPYSESVSRNWFPQDLAESVARFRSCSAVVAAALHARDIFEDKQEALIHGDLHTGSVMRLSSGVHVVFDTEFCRFGPAMFDLGVFMANVVFAAIRARQNAGVGSCLRWLQEAESSWSRFARTTALLDVDDEGGDRSREYLRELGEFCVVELARRVIGLAKVPELEDFRSRQGCDAGRYALRCAELVAECTQDSELSIGTYIDSAHHALGLDVD